MSAERAPLTAADPSDLDAAALTAFAGKRAASLALAEDDLLVRLGLLAKMGQKLHPTPVGLLLFGRCPQLFHPEWGVSVVRVDGVALSDPIAARGDLEGSVPALLAAATTFVKDESDRDLDPTGPKAAFPEDAVREALVNALVHRDLRRPMRVAVRLFSDRLEIASPGGLPEGLGDAEDALETGGISLPRNPLLAALARQMGLGEQLGRGLAVVRRSVMETTGLRAEVEATTTSVLVRIPSRLAARRASLL